MNHMTENRDIFNVTLDTDIPALLCDLWDEKRIRVHPLPDMKGARELQLYQYGKNGGVIPVEEFADYRDLSTDEVTDSKKVVESLARAAARSYAWNVRNAYIKGGRLRFDERLHITDWESEFRFNVVLNTVPCSVADPQPPSG